MIDTRLEFRYIDDYGPLGIRVYQHCPYPREYVDFELGQIGKITLPRSMTKKEWDFLHEWLELTRVAGMVIE